MISFNRYYLVLAAMLFSVTAHAQLVVDGNYTPQQLIEDVLIGQGVQVSNFQFTGDAQSRGFFDGSNSNIGLESGVILSTGRAADAVGPNSTVAGSLSEDGTDFSRPGDSDLSGISGSLNGTFDAAVLEFDFIPSSDTVRFKYVFASNEYMFWVGTSNINDVFAFFLSGPGLVGEQNVALIPGTTTPISMVNVNANTNSQYYVDNGDQAGEEGAPTVKYNGFTTPLSAIAVLIPCETYTIRLAIADGGDGSYDSAVFLDAGSFTSPSVSLNAESNFSTSTNAQDLVEGCSTLNLTFERSEPFDAPLTVGLSFTGTATVGTDVSNIPNFITFPAGQATTTISFDVLEDFTPDGTETMTITLDQLNPCATGPASALTFTIQDAIPITLQITPDESFICPDEHAIDVIITGGYPVYDYQWSGSPETDGNILVNPFTSTNYSVVVTDACGFTATASSLVSVNYQPLQVSVADEVVCNGDDAELLATVSGGLGDVSYLWDGGSGTDTSYTFSPPATTTVLLQITDSCGISESITATVNVDELEASFTYRLIKHSTVQFTNTTIGVTDFSWDFGDGLTSVRQSPLHEYDGEGDYIVSLIVVNSNGCEAIVQDTVTVYPPLRVYVPNAFSPNGDGINDVFGVEGQGFLYYDLEIFDRWGNKMRHGRFRDNTAWDGKYNGTFVPSGAYIYHLWVEPPVGIEVRETGVLHVLSGK
jgi:gliding motility-associated-like protein